MPEALIPPAGARVMSLQDGTSKMSKSAESDLSRINLLDPTDAIVQKVKVGWQASCQGQGCIAGARAGQLAICRGRGGGRSRDGGQGHRTWQATWRRTRLGGACMRRSVWSL